MSSLNAGTVTSVPLLGPTVDNFRGFAPNAVNEIAFASTTPSPSIVSNQSPPQQQQSTFASNDLTFIVRGTETICTPILTVPTTYLIDGVDMLTIRNQSKYIGQYKYNVPPSYEAPVSIFVLRSARPCLMWGKNNLPKRSDKKDPCCCRA
jgi:hypothetical protein